MQQDSQQDKTYMLGNLLRVDFYAAAVAFGCNEFGQLARGPSAQCLRSFDPKAMQVDRSKPFLQGQVPSH